MAYTTHEMSTTYSGEEMTARAIDYVEKYCGICIEPVILIAEVDGGHHALLLPKGPVIQIVEVRDMFASAAGAEVDTDLYRLSAEGKVVARAGSSWGSGEDRFSVQYEAGYEDLPEALKILIEEIEAYAEAWAGGAGLRAEKFGRDYAWEAALAMDAEVAPLMKRLNLWRRL